MATRADYRQTLRDRLAGIEESGYGNFDFLDTELNTYLELGVAKLFPALYARASLTSQSATSYGNNGYRSVSVSVDESHIFAVEDATELSLIRGWQTRPGKVVGIPDENTTVNVHYITAYAMPSDDVTPVTWPVVFKPLIVLGALIEAIASRNDKGVRPDPGTGEGRGMSLMLQTLQSSYDRLKSEMGLSMPVVLV